MNESNPAVAPRILLVGNPNVGKSTLFNRLSGGHARSGNYPGVTVERHEGTWNLGSGDGGELVAELVDLPGAYSLSAHSAEEQLTLRAVLALDNEPAPALVIVVVDASHLLRNLYLVLQLCELEVPLIIALTMLDEVQGAAVSPALVGQAFGVPCVAISPLTGDGLDELRRLSAEALDQPPTPALPAVDYPAALRADLQQLTAALPSQWRSRPRRDTALALWALTSIDAEDELVGIDAGLRGAVRVVQQEALQSPEPRRDLEQEVIGSRYAWLDALLPRLGVERAAQGGADAAAAARFTPSWTDRLDRWLLHPWLGMAAFLLIMFGIFQTLFAWADPAITAIETVMSELQGVVQRGLPPGIVNDLLSNGLVGGVGNVVVFLPQILLLFLLLGLLEDSGYMARVAYLMDRVMRAMGGLHGRAFVPMLSGYACAVPAILATRTMERRRDRLLTILVIPLMSCSARLPVYTLVVAALFPPTHWFGFVPVQSLLMVAMYAFSTVIALLAAGVLGRTAVRGRRVPLILELPPYRWPSLAVTLRRTLRQAGEFLKGAGTTILVFTALLWCLLSFPRLPDSMATPHLDPQQQRAAALEHSYAGRLGKAIEPVLRPLGFDWKIGIGILGAFAAREVFVSTLGMVYGIENADESNQPLRARIRAEADAQGRLKYTPLMGLSLMVFFALACQCVSTLAVAQRETRSWRWPLFMLLYMTALAWVASFVVYQGGKLLGW